MIQPDPHRARDGNGHSVRVTFSEFLRDLRRRKRHAIQRLVDRYESLAMNTVRRHLGTQLRKRVDSHDLRQDFWVSIIRRIDRLPSIADSQAFRGYLKRVAFRQVTKQQRRHLVAASRRVSREVPMSTVGEGYGEALAGGGALRPDDAVAGEDLLSQIRPHLTDREFDVLIMKLDGTSNREIARQMGIDEGSVRRELRKIARAFVRVAPPET